MNKIRIVILIIVTFLLVVAFGCNKLNKGVVLDKGVESAYEYTQMVQVPIGNNQILMPQTVHVDADFWIVVKGVGVESHITETIHMSSYDYSKVKLNDTIIIKQ